MPRPGATRPSPALCSVPEIDDDIDVEIDETGPAGRYLPASGAGGQHVNKTDSAVRLTTIPTGRRRAVPERALPAQEQGDTAMKVLRAQLYELERREQEAEGRLRSRRARSGRSASAARFAPIHSTPSSGSRTIVPTPRGRQTSRPCWTATSTASSASHLAAPIEWTLSGESAEGVRVTSMDHRD